MKNYFSFLGGGNTEDISREMKDPLVVAYENIADNYYAPKLKKESQEEAEQLVTIGADQESTCGY